MLDPLKQYFGLLAIMISIGGTVYAWLTSRSRGNEKHLEETDAHLSDHETRLTQLESEFRHLPTKEGQHRIEVAMADIAGDMKQMTEAQTSLRNTVARMETVMLERGGK